jgi:ABC-type hemin transport system ATPase subunit
MCWAALGIQGDAGHPTMLGESPRRASRPLAARGVVKVAGGDILSTLVGTEQHRIRRQRILAQDSNSRMERRQDTPSATCLWR